MKNDNERIVLCITDTIVSNSRLKEMQSYFKSEGYIMLDSLIFSSTDQLHELRSDDLDQTTLMPSTLSKLIGFYNGVKEQIAGKIVAINHRLDDLTNHVFVIDPKKLS